MEMKKVPGTKYAHATEDGRIWSSYWRRYLSPYVNHAGYLCIDVAVDDGGTRGFRVNRMVAMAFHPNPNGLPEVNHKNKNRQDNAASNLEWCTAQQNSEHGKGHRVRLLDPFGVIHESASLKRLCRENGLSQGNVHAMLAGKTSHVEGWRNADIESGPFTGRRKRKNAVFLRSPAGDLHEVANVREFALSHGLQSSSVNHLISGRRKSHKGWRLDEDLMMAIYGERRAA